MSCCAQSELLGVHVLGLASEKEAGEVRVHISECPSCASELRDLEAAAAKLAYVAPSVTLPNGLRDRVLRRVAQPTPSSPQIWKQWESTGAAAVSDLHVVRSGDGDWQEVRQGVFAKQLYVDRSRDLATMLVRMEPGSQYVPHRHAAPEQCFVLEGDIREGEHVFRAGDFQCLSAGSTHEAQWTEEGCLLLIVSSLNDELL